MRKIGIIGAGNMGEAIFASAKKKFSIFLCESGRKRQNYLRKIYGVKTKSLLELVKFCDVLILAVKPQNIDEILGQLKDIPIKNKLIISIAAGVTTSYVEKKIHKSVRVIRTMPNLPVQIQQGMTAICKGKNAKQADIKLACSIFDILGQTVVVQEKAIDAITAVSGSGPGYVYLFMEQMIKSAKFLGLNEKLAKQLVEQTFSGSVALLKQSKQDAQSLRIKVSSKGGTTQAAVDFFLKKKIDVIFNQALSAAQKKAKTLSRR